MRFVIYMLPTVFLKERLLLISKCHTHSAYPHAQFLTVKTGSVRLFCSRCISFNSFISLRVRTAAARSRTSEAPPAFFLTSVVAAGLAGRLAAAASAGLTPSL